MYTLIVLFAFYSWIHAIVINFIEKKEYKNCTGYEKFITVSAVSTLILTLIGILS